MENIKTKKEKFIEGLKQGGLVLLGAIIGVSYLIAYQAYQNLSDFIK
jgi:hypothetical protein